MGDGMVEDSTMFVGTTKAMGYSMTVPASMIPVGQWESLGLIVLCANFESYVCETLLGCNRKVGSTNKYILTHFAT